MIAWLRIAICVVISLSTLVAWPGVAALADPQAGDAAEPVQPGGPAAPGEPVAPTPVAGGPEVAWPQLGLPEELLLQSAEPQRTVTIPVPNGAAPVVLTGQVESDYNAANCRVEVFDSAHQQLGFIAPPENLAASPFSLDISRAAKAGNGVELSFVLGQDGPPAEHCAQTLQPSTIGLSRLAIAYSGSSNAPTTLADFLPGYLRRLVIDLGSNPSADVQQATLSLVANLTHLYSPTPIRIDVDTSDRAAARPPDPYGGTRVISIREDSTAGIALVNPGSPEATLVISGEGESLRRQVALFADRRFELAQSTTGSVKAAAELPDPIGTVKTFGQLGMAGQLSVIGTDTLYLGFDASQFGVGAIDGCEIDLVAKYTPVIDGDSSVVVRAGPRVIGTYVLDESGSLHVKARIPSDAIQSDVGLALDIRYLPRTGGAPPPNRLTFYVQPESTVQVFPGSDTRRGFSVLPMAFSPAFDVAVDQPDRIRYAAAVINLLGLQTRTTMRPRLVPMDSATSSGSGLLIVASSDEVARRGFKLPISLAGGDAVSVEANSKIEIDLDGPLGLIQTATSDTRTVLAVSATQEWSLVDQAIDHLWSLSGQWRALTGDVLATGASGESVNLAVNQGGAWADLHPGRGWTWWAWLSIAAAIAVAAVGGATVLSRMIRRKRRQGSESSPPPPSP